MHYYRRLSWKQYAKLRNKSFQPIGIQLGFLRNVIGLSVADVAKTLKIPCYVIHHFEEGNCARASHQTMRHLLNYYLNYALHKKHFLL